MFLSGYDSCFWTDCYYYCPMLAIPYMTSAASIHIPPKVHAQLDVLSKSILYHSLHRGGGQVAGLSVFSFASGGAVVCMIRPGSTGTF